MEPLRDLKSKGHPSTRDRYNQGIREYGMSNKEIPKDLPSDLARWISVIHDGKVTNPSEDVYDERLSPRPSPAALRKGLKPHIIALRINGNNPHRDLLSHTNRPSRLNEHCDVDLIELNEW